MLNSTRFSLKSVRISSYCKLLGKEGRGEKPTQERKKKTDPNIRKGFECCQLLQGLYIGYFVI